MAPLIFDNPPTNTFNEMLDLDMLSNLALLLDRPLW
jgi:hypothetical protein